MQTSTVLVQPADALLPTCPRAWLGVQQCPCSAAAAWLAGHHPSDALMQSRTDPTTTWPINLSIEELHGG